MEINVSLALAHQNCPTYAHIRDTLGYIPLHYRDPALDTGSAGHAVLEKFLRAHLEGEPIPVETEVWEEGIRDALLADWAKRGLEPDLDTLADTKILGRAITDFFIRGPKWDSLLAVERVLRMPFGLEHELIGKLDTVVRTRGTLRHGQWKFLSPRSDLGSWMWQAGKSWHETGYAALGQKEWPGERWGGSNYTIFWKQPSHVRSKGGTCSCCGRKGLVPRPATQLWHYEELHVPPVLAERRLAQLSRLADQIDFERLKIL